MNNHQLVTLNDTEGTITTNSRIVAETYDKRHSHVIRDIEALIKEINDLEEQEELPTRPNFGLSEYIDASGRSNKMYLLDRNAWSLLVMGYTGTDATRFKLRYIAAFDAMEAQLIKIAESQLANAKETIKTLESQRVLLETSMKRRFTLTEASRKIGLTVIEMNKALKERGYLTKFEYNVNEPVKHLKDGHLFIVEVGYKSSKMKWPNRKTYVTWAGIQWIKGVLEDILIGKGIIAIADTGYHNDF